MSENKRRLHIRMLQLRFVPLLLNGSKTTTIRPKPKREINPGDVIEFRQWRGKPYRSKQKFVVCRVVKSVSPISIFEDRTSEWVAGMNASEAVAKDDGFSSFAEMRDWFKAAHGLPFHGIVIHWNTP